ALAAIMAEWTRTDLVYSARVHHLLHGGGLNSSYLLNSSTFTSNGGANTLTGASGLDLFFGSLARDANDWNARQGEIFVEQAAIHARTLIDARGLGQTPLDVDNVNHDTTVPFRVQLAPGSQHWFYSGGAFQYFSVADDGTVGYDQALEGALTG